MIGNKTLVVPGPTNMPFEIRQAMTSRWKIIVRPTSPILSSRSSPIQSVFRLQSGRVFVFLAPALPGGKPRSAIACRRATWC